MNKKTRRYLAIGVPILVVALFLGLFMFMTSDQQYWDLTQRFDAFVCKLSGGDYGTIGPVGGCKTDSYYQRQMDLCQNSGGQWVSPLCIGCDYLRDGFCECVTQPYVDYRCLVGSPLADCQCYPADYDVQVGGPCLLNGDCITNICIKNICIDGRI
jgi:hypothetical protein